ncbi:MAG: P-loop NTPase, partial [Bdellovibrionales bacterium]|nr:P-loop NTPase [Bdellovibrionales bacterium]
ALRYGVKFISIAFFLRNPDDAVVWRGPMFGKAIHQLFHDVQLGDIDIAVIDLPPGTGDAQLSLAQMVNLDGAVVVTTLQEVAVSDVRRAIKMFEKVNVDVLGVIENMAGFTAPSGERFDIFGTGGGEELAAQYSIPFLGSLPLDMAIRVGGDRGEPVALDRTSASGKLFTELAERVLSEIRSRKGSQPVLNVVN